MEALATKDTWERVLARIQTKVNARSFSVWFKPTQLARESDGTLFVRVPTTWHAEWLRSNFWAAIQEALAELGRPGVSLRFVVDGEPEASNDEVPLLNPRYRFDTFVVSSCNDFAHAAAMAVARQPGRAYNPLYIHGGSGLGKTHLLHAIHHEAGPDVRRAEYISAEQFVNDLINAIRFERTTEFRNRYRNVNLLLIDDIQFLAGKERTQEEFFHTFNTLYESGRQIVIAGDCLPREIPTLQDRLRSRFQWGLIADIQPPDLETKVAILRKKSELYGVELPPDVALFVASSTGANVRELEGALLKLVATASVNGAAIGLEMARESLKDLVGPQPPSATIEAIQKLVANHYNLKVSDLKARNNSPQVAFPRQVAMYLCKLLTPASLPEIGRKFGGKHHSTVIHAVQKIEMMRSREAELDRLLETLAGSLR